MLTFNTKCGSLRRLSDAGKHIELQVGSQGLDQSDGCGALSFTQWGRSNSAVKVINVNQMLHIVKEKTTKLQTIYCFTLQK